MSLRNFGPPSSRNKVAEFLADREGLHGGARRRFLNLLDEEYGSFRQVARPRSGRTLSLISLMLAVVGFVLDNRPAWPDGLVWPGCVLLAAAPIRRFQRDESEAPDTDRETDWQAYCLFLRPVILSEHPGLLDRNKHSLVEESVQDRLRSRVMLYNLARERGSDFWWSAVFGLWCGMAALLVVHRDVTVTAWVVSLLFPVLGLLLGPVIRTLLRRVIYAVARGDSRMFGP